MTGKEVELHMFYSLRVAMRSIAASPRFVICTTGGLPLVNLKTEFTNLAENRLQAFVQVPLLWSMLISGLYPFPLQVCAFCKHGLIARTQKELRRHFLERQVVRS